MRDVPLSWLESRFTALMYRIPGSREYLEYKLKLDLILCYNFFFLDYYRCLDRKFWPEKSAQAKITSSMIKSIST